MKRIILIIFALAMLIMTIANLVVNMFFIFIYLSPKTFNFILYWVSSGILFIFAILIFLPIKDDSESNLTVLYILCFVFLSLLAFCLIDNINYYNTSILFNLANLTSYKSNLYYLFIVTEKAQIANIFVLQSGMDFSNGQLAIIIGILGLEIVLIVLDYIQKGKLPVEKEEVEEESWIYCPNCENKISGKVDFCPHCGKNITIPGLREDEVKCRVYDIVFFGGLCYSTPLFLIFAGVFGSSELARFLFYSVLGIGIILLGCSSLHIYRERKKVLAYSTFFVSLIGGLILVTFAIIGTFFLGLVNKSVFADLWAIPFNFIGMFFTLIGLYLIIYHDIMNHKALSICAGIHALILGNFTLLFSNLYLVNHGVANNIYAIIALVFLLITSLLVGITFHGEIAIETFINNIPRASLIFLILGLIAFVPGLMGILSLMSQDINFYLGHILAYFIFLVVPGVSNLAKFISLLNQSSEDEVERERRLIYEEIEKKRNNLR